MEKNNLTPLPETRNLLSMWGTSETDIETTPVIRRNYFAMPGLIRQAAKPMPYLRQPGRMLAKQFEPPFIKEQVMEALGLTHKAIQGNGRLQYMVDGRCIIVWLCYKYAFTCTMRDISRLIKRDRTTAIHMIARANNAIETNEIAFIEKLQCAESRLLNQ